MEKNEGESVGLLTKKKEYVVKDRSGKIVEVAQAFFYWLFGFAYIGKENKCLYMNMSVMKALDSQPP